MDRLADGVNFWFNFYKKSMEATLFWTFIAKQYDQNK
jgi:hypothetical protein